MVGYLATEDDFRTRGKHLVCGLAQFLTDALKLVAPNRGLHFGHGPAFSFLDKAEVQMLGTAPVQFGNFRTKPHDLARRDLLERSLQAASQLGKGVNGFFGRGVGGGVHQKPANFQVRWAPSCAAK